MDLLGTIWKYPLRLQWKAMKKVLRLKKVSPEGMCRQLTTAYKEMDEIDSIVEQSKRSDLQQDYVQINEILLQKRKFLEEWVSRFHCPIENCKLHNSPKINVISVNSSNVKNLNSVNSRNVNVVNTSNANKVTGNVKSKTKRNASQISSNTNDSGEFRTPSKS
ncbi:hypothetical protein CEXT_470361 [Caerostris extrusa]|uniref:Uncharacterized protein n=1 Tax=Caerostris extrusa TaxID=172846 RepID=A0AAV4XYV6_CAEEX|nr:hypothetical protein CEXT_470361 [Caerostris extrusa]